MLVYSGAETQTRGACDVVPLGQFAVGEAPLNLVDASGNESNVRVIAMLGQSSLLEYRRQTGT